MQFGRGVVCPEEMGFQIHGSWIPTTPSKPEQMSYHVQRPHWADMVSATRCGSGFFQEVGCENGASSSISVEAAAAMQSGSLSFAEQMQRIGNWEAAVASQTRVSGLETYAEAFRNATDKWNRISSAGISAAKGTISTAAAQNDGNSLSSFRPILHSQNTFSSQQGELSSMSMKHMSQNSMSGLNLEGNSHFLPQTPQKQTTQPTTSCPYYTNSNFRTNYTTNRLSTPAKTIADAVTSGNISFQLVPETLDRRRNKTNHKGVEFSIVNDRVIQDQKQEDEHPPVIMPPSGTEPVKVQQALSEPAVLSTPVKRLDKVCREEGQIDLNETPLQKRPKRKKHMPKVVVEGKPRRTPKPETPAKDSPHQKRKYVRRSGPKAFTGVASSDVGETVNPTTRQAVRSSCKRVLNYDLEVQGADGCINTTEVHQNMQNSTTRIFSDPASCIQASNLSLHFDAQDGYKGINRNSEPKPTIQLAQGLEVVVGQSQSGTLFDLDCFFTQLPGDCISLPNKIKTSPPSPKKSFPIENTEALLRKKENGKTVGAYKSNSDSTYILLHQNAHAKESDCVISSRQYTHESSETNRVVTQNVLQSVTNVQPHSTISQNILPVVNNSLSKGSKREYVNGVCLSPSPGHMLPFGGPNICKKRRIEATHDELTPSASSLMASGNGIIQTTMNMVNEIGSNAFMLITSDGRPFPLCNFLKQKKEPSKGISNASSVVCSKAIFGENNQKIPSSSREMLLCMSTQNEIEFSKQQALTARIANARAKETVQVNDMRLPLAAMKPQQPQRTSAEVTFAHDKSQEGNVFHDVKCNLEAPAQEEMKNQLAILATSVFPRFTNQMPQEHNSDDYSQSLGDSGSTSLGKNHVMFATFPSQRIQPRSSNNNSSQDCPTSSNILCKPDTMFSGVIMLQMDPTDKLGEEMEFSNINRSSEMVTAQEQNALVPYTRYGPVVPVEGPSHSTKAKQPRPIVDVDKETERLWGILMAHSSDEIPEAMDAEKEKWWEEQRRVFQGRVDSFIARMHLVQGLRTMHFVCPLLFLYISRKCTPWTSNKSIKQGDRRFSRWKGSVVDSVVGVFLTQNVSDHLSSSAFMNLAARFPPKSRTHSGAEQTSASENEQDASMLDSYKWQNKISKKKFQSKGSVTFNEAEPLEEKELASWNESFASNMCFSSPISSKDRPSSNYQNLTEVWHESQENPTTIVHRATEGACLSDVDDQRGLDEVVSSQNSVISYQNFAESTIQKIDQNLHILESNFDEDNLILEFNGSMSFMKLLQMDGRNIFENFYTGENSRTSSKENLESPTNQSETRKCEKGTPYFATDDLVAASPSTKTTDSQRGLLATAQIGGLSKESKHAFRLSSNLAPEANIEQHQFINSWERTDVPSGDGTDSRWSHIQSQKNVCSLRGDRVGDSQSKSVEVADIADHQNQVEATFHGQHLGMQPNHSKFPHHVGDRLYIAESSSTANKPKIAEINFVQPNASDEASSSKSTLAATTNNTPKRRKEKSATDKTNDFDWENLRQQVCHNHKGKERGSDVMDAVDWEAIRCADVEEISETIKERGMNNMLAERIQKFLNRVASDHGSIDLEWLRDVPPEKAKEYLLSIRGLGLKSTECVRLLTLHHDAFPVDTNVGRVSVRLGWVPLQPLPESLQIHLLEQYPVIASVQKYLWPRLCKLDQRTLYELHYQMITFGKVFCTKRNPNCNACPMRAECKHFASAFASARLALPGPEEKSLVSSVSPAAEHGPKVVIHPIQLPPTEGNANPKEYRSNQCEPIIEEPATPELEPIDASEAEIEDAFWQDDPDDIPTIKLNLEEFTTNVQTFMNEDNKVLQDADLSKALVALLPQAASIPMPKLKNVGRLRTEHQAYELPDSHPLLAELDRREPDDPCSYLLAIWTPGETADSIEPPGICCHSQDSSSLCDQKTCFSCNSIREANSHTVRGTLLIPCRTAMRGRFPLNGTYFQVNEVFADHESSIQPIDVPREWIWNLPRRTVFFGTSIPTIFQGLTMVGIQQCFWRGFVCVRGFDRKTRAPRPLTARQHLPASKLVRLKRKENSKANNAEGSMT